jgi:hypothetical protein
MAARGGTIIEHGYTHQYSNVPNPYSAVSADDFEFYRSQCSATQTAPYSFDSVCPDSDWIIEEGPLPGDSSAWAQGRVLTGQSLFQAAGVPTPTIWETPHYAASAADYSGIDTVFKVRYERDLLFGGQITPGATPDPTHAYGQFFPYAVTDVNGETVLPEDLGNYSPAESNHNPPKPVSYLVGNAQAELAVRQGVASFFYHPYFGLATLQQIVQGIQALGYTFVAPNSLVPTTAPALQMTTPSLPVGKVGSSYTKTLLVSGGSAPYTWSVVAGVLPPGLTFDPVHSRVSGTPRAAGTWDFTVQVADSTSPVHQVHLRTYVLRVA